MHRIVLSLAFIVLLSATLSAQVTGTSGTSLPIQRDQQALTAIQAAITALGGATAIGQVQSLQVEAQGQGVAPNGQQVNGTVTWEWEMPDPELRIASVTNLGSGTVVSGYGNPVMVTSAGSVKLPSYAMAATFIPALVAPTLLQEFQNSDCELRYGGPKTLGQESVTVVRTQCLSVPNSIVTAQTWYFDTTTALPVRVEFRIPSMHVPRLSILGAVALSNYQPVSGVQYPFQVVSYRQGKQTGTVTLQSVNVNAAIPSSDFDPPAGGAQ